MYDCMMDTMMMTTLMNNHGYYYDGMYTHSMGTSTHVVHHSNAAMGLFIFLFLVILAIIVVGVLA